ncbi:NH(3)-dependent NAD(+) synthetase [Actinobacillus pleuropneumoniae]|nr:NH(3)-dependent NAD(+) synthetase [Actinobacillus pleuropneumoniae]
MSNLTINVEEEVRKRVDFLKNYVKNSGTSGLLIAISGGIDSAVAAGLCKRATDELTEENGKEYKTLGGVPAIRRTGRYFRQLRNGEGLRFEIYRRDQYRGGGERGLLWRWSMA